MRKTKLDQDTVKLILQLHENGNSINKIVNELGVLRRVVKRTLIENNVSVRTKSELILQSMPILSDRDKLIDLYYRRNMSIDEIACHIGTNSQIIKNCFKKLDIETIPQNIKRISKHTPEKLRDKQFLISEYVDKKCSVSSLAKRFNVSDTCVKTMLDFYNVSRRSHKQQMRVAVKTEEQKLNARIARRLRSRLSNALSNDQKVGSAVRDLGCSIEELKKHLQSQFSEGMSWDNYNYHGWHIDHIRPLSSFDLTDVEQFKQANHYTNLQPMWSMDNFKKSSSTSRKVDLFIVCGLSGSGKSWVCNSLKNKLHYVSYDEVPKEEHYYEFKEATNRGSSIIYDPFRNPTGICRRYSGEFNVRLMVIEEDVETIVSRIESRGGSPNVDKISQALKKMPRWKSCAEFSGTSTEVLAYLKSQVES
jgi:hypothetical protein